MQIRKGMQVYITQGHHTDLNVELAVASQSLMPPFFSLSQKSGGDSVKTLKRSYQQARVFSGILKKRKKLATTKKYE